MVGRSTGIAAALLLAVAPAGAEVLAEVDGLVVADGAAQSSGPTARTGAGYFSVSNTSEEDDRLLAVESEAGQRVELHATVLENGVARMVPVEEGISVPAGETITLEQGDVHVMFMGLTDAWNSETGVPARLVFEKAGIVDVVLPVAANQGGHAIRGREAEEPGSEAHSGNSGH